MIPASTQRQYEFDCGCGIPAKEREEVLAQFNLNPFRWHQVLAPQAKCRTCGGRQRHFFKRMKPRSAR
jgi:hypothetical protein